MSLFIKNLNDMNWNYPTNIWFGNKRIKDLTIACNQLNIKRLLFVTDPGLAKTIMVEQIISNLKKNNLQVNLFCDLKPNPVGSNVMQGVKCFNDNNCEGVVAFGGGSGLDTGKGIAFMSKQDRPIWDFEDIGDYWKRAKSELIKPIIAVPTTAGTGSETGRASVFINEETLEKKIIFHPEMMPKIVILDPELTLNLPKNLTAATGMDALAHNLEAFCSPFFHPMAAGIAVEGLRIIKEYLPKVVKDGKDLDARAYMLVSSTMGSTAFQKGLGAIHSLSHPVNSVFNIHHGLSNAVFMPYVLTFNRSAIETKISKLSEYLELKKKSFNSFVDWVLALREEIKIPHKLSDCAKITDQDIEKLSPMALNDPCTPENPKKTNLEDMKLMYRNSIEGKLFD